MHAAVLALALAAPAAPPPDATASVRTGLKWLAGRQHADGSWSGAGGVEPTTITAYAGLALLMEGSTPARGTYAAELRKAVAWFEAKAQADGRITSGAATEGGLVFPYHAHALFFLVCAYDVDDDGPRRARLAKLIDKAVAFVAANQTTRGGWGHISGPANADYDNARNTGLVLDALLAARKAGIAVPEQTTARAARYFARATNGDGGVIYGLFNGVEVRPRGNDGLPMLSTLAATCALSAGARDAHLRLWVANARANTPEPDAASVRAAGLSGMLQQYYLARVAFGLGETGAEQLDPGARGTRWSAHRTKLFRELLALQYKDGRWTEPIYGPEYMTALALVTLQLDNQFVTAFAR